MAMDERGAAYLEAVAQRVVIFDGAMGTSLQLADLSAEDYGGPALEGCSEAVVLHRPDVVKAIHRSFLDVGCDVVEANAFGAFGVVLAEYGLQDRVEEINVTAARLAREAAEEAAAAAGDGRPRWVAGNMGPGTRFPTLGQIPYLELRDAYQEQSAALHRGGRRPHHHRDRLRPAPGQGGHQRGEGAMVAAGRRVPLQVQVTIELTGRMLPGTEVGAALTALDPMRPDVIGLNCATGPAEMGEAIRYLCQHARLPVSAQPNAGLPSVVDGKMHYDLTPDQLADHLERFITELGVSVVGGCCGTTPDHLRAVVQRCRDLVPAPRPAASIEHEPGASSIYSNVAFHQDTSFLVVGERTNANGSKKFREAMLEADWDTTVAIGRDQVKEGAHVLDVCVDYTGADGVADMTEVASRLATQASVPLMVDSTEAPVVEAALMWIGGRPILNSVNLEEGDDPGTRLDKFLTLAREYGAAVVCTCIDTEGQARTADWKVRAAAAIRDIAVDRYGLEPSDLIFDPLVLPLSTGMEESRRDGIETLEGTRRIKAELPGVFTIVGPVQRVVRPQPRGAPRAQLDVPPRVRRGRARRRDRRTRHDHPVEQDRRARPRGLPRPHLRPPRRAPATTRCRSSWPSSRVCPPRPPVAEDRSGWPVERRLEQRIIDGDRNGLDDDLAEALGSGHGALTIVNDFLLAGMKTVGELFATGEMQLPFVLQSAETMKAAVSYLEPFMEKADQGGKGTVVLATVKGDVHDIGKNLVDIILTNNGYEIVNLGIKVNIGEMLQAAEDHKADAIGMSGLLVKSTLIMRENLEEMNTRNLAHIPVLLGGAALTRNYVERDLRSVYEGRLFYGKDAFEGLRTMDRLVELKKTGEDDPTSDARSAERHLPPRERDGRRAPSSLPTRSPEVATDNPSSRPRSWARAWPRASRSTTSRRISTLRRCSATNGGIAPSKGDGRRRRFKERVSAELREELDKAKAKDLLIPQVAYGYFAANAEGDDLVLWTDETAPSELDALLVPPPEERAVPLYRRLLPVGGVRRARLRRVHARDHGVGGLGGRQSASPRTGTPITSSSTASGSRWPKPWPSTGTAASARSWASPTRTAPP